jgi:hypothetical protein
LRLRTYGIDSSEFKFGLNSRTAFDPDVALQYRLAPWPRNLWVVEAQDRQYRGDAGGSVLGEVLVDPTANHYPSQFDPGILAAHVPGFWMRQSTDDDSQQSGNCGEGRYETGRPDYSAGLVHQRVSDRRETDTKLWISSALTPHGGEYGLVAVVAETRQEAIAKVNAKLQIDDPGNYVPNKTYAEALLDNLDALREVTDEVFIDWDAP